MNSDIVVGRWKQWRGNFWALWSEWFDSDCAWLESNNDTLSGILQEDYGLQQGDEAVTASNGQAGASKLH